MSEVVIVEPAHSARRAEHEELLWRPLWETRGVRPKVRRLARQLLPSLAAERARRYEAASVSRSGVTAIARRSTERVGRTVLSGPFAGMRMIEGFEENAQSPVAKLAGVYEAALHDAVETAIAREPRTVVNVGCAEGYYAVGFARRLPEAVVHAHDLARSAREMTRALARLNGVQQRVRVHGRRRGFGQEVDVVLCDIEGDEGALLSPAELRQAMLIVETHDDAAPGVTQLLARRFATTHEVETLSAAPAEPPDQLRWLSEAELALALDEMRPHRQRWLVMTPRLSI